MFPKFDWLSALKIMAALVISGFVWTQDNQAALLSLAAMLLVWGIKVYAARSGKRLGKEWLTGILLAVSVAFAYLFQPVEIPPFPVYSGDVLGFAQACFVYAGDVLAVSGSVFALATGLYNILLAQVLGGLSDAMLLRMRVKSVAKKK